VVRGVGGTGGGAVGPDSQQVLKYFTKQVLHRPTQGTSQAETRHRLLTKTIVAKTFWDPGVQCVKSRAHNFVGQLQEAANAFSSGPPDHVLLVQYQSANFPVSVFAVSGTCGVVRLLSSRSSSSECRHEFLRSDSVNANFEGLFNYSVTSW
jgi:hypothetical protein